MKLLGLRRSKDVVTSEAVAPRPLSLEELRNKGIATLIATVFAEEQHLVNKVMCDQLGTIADDLTRRGAEQDALPLRRAQALYLGQLGFREEAQLALSATQAE